MLFLERQDLHWLYLASRELFGMTTAASSSDNLLARLPNCDKAVQHVNVVMQHLLVLCCHFAAWHIYHLKSVLL